jgi:molybdenum cofactor cytidylyltransferase
MIFSRIEVREAEGAIIAHRIRLPGITVASVDIQMMGVGGLIKDIPHIHRRRQKISKYLRPTLTPTKVAAVILAAGLSRRMGAQNKLLAAVGEVPMISQVVRAAVESNVQQVVVVTGHEAELVQKALLDYRAEIVFNPDYESGIASSIRTGIENVAEEMDGALILLGDMPRISDEQINELIAEFNPAMERDIVVPFKDGQRGNPVLWSSRYFASLKKLTGDTGGKGLMLENIGNVWDVPVTDDAVFADYDTPDSLQHLD